MRALTFLVISCILITISYSASDFDVSLFGEDSLSVPVQDSLGFSDQDSLNFLGEDSLSLPNPDSLNFLDDPSIQTTNPLDQSTGSDINTFLDDPLSQTTEPDSSFLLADDINCDAFNADDTQLFGKRRRDAACTNPSTSSAKPKKPKKGFGPTNDPFNFNEFIKTRPSLADFQESSDACPAFYFGDSNTPVCSTEFTIPLARQPLLSLRLLDVDPGTLACASEFESSNFDDQMLICPEKSFNTRLNARKAVLCFAVNTCYMRYVLNMEPGNN